MLQRIISISPMQLRKMMLLIRLSARGIGMGACLLRMRTFIGHILCQIGLIIHDLGDCSRGLDRMRRPRQPRHRGPWRYRCMSLRDQIWRSRHPCHQGRVLCLQQDPVMYRRIYLLGQMRQTQYLHVRTQCLHGRTQYLQDRCITHIICTHLLPLIHILIDHPLDPPVRRLIFVAPLLAIPAHAQHLQHQAHHHHSINFST